MFANTFVNEYGSSILRPPTIIDLDMGAATWTLDGNYQYYTDIAIDYLDKSLIHARILHAGNVATDSASYSYGFTAHIVSETVLRLYTWNGTYLPVNGSVKIAIDEYHPGHLKMHHYLEKEPGTGAVWVNYDVAITPVDRLKSRLHLNMTGGQRFRDAAGNYTTYGLEIDFYSNSVVRSRVYEFGTNREYHYAFTVEQQLGA